jgi:hypothetical protein
MRQGRPIWLALFIFERFISKIEPMLNKVKLTILIITIILQSCGSLLDFSGKGAKTKCSALSTDKLTINCNCTDKQISTMTVYNNKNSKENFGVKTLDFVFNPAINVFSLPISKDTADKIFLQIEIHLTNSHYRESYYIETKPGDFSKDRKIYSKFISH